MRRKVEELYRERSIDTAGQLPFQGEMLALMGEEKKDISWKATIYKVPRGLLSEE